MSMEPVLEQSETQQAPVSLPFPIKWWGRALYGLFVIALPAFSFWATFLVEPEWQDGKLSSYIILSLYPKASLLFFPLLAYSIVCYWLLLFAPSRFSRSFVIRTGIYTGLLLALQYCIIILIFSLDTYLKILLVVWVSPFILLWIYRRVVAKWTASKVNVFLLVFVVVAALIGTLLTRGSLLVLALIFLIMVAPLWSFLIALRAAIWSFKNHETSFTIFRGLGLTAWIAGYAIAWRYDILKMFEIYTRLPPQPPSDCYIATAATEGHPRFVGSHTVQRADGKSMRVNGQLQTLKCAELALLAVNPRLHKTLRRIYDVVGKSLARRMKKPFVADIAYLLLKPAEWCAFFVLEWIVPEIESISRRMYTR